MTISLRLLLQCVRFDVNAYCLSLRRASYCIKVIVLNRSIQIASAPELYILLYPPPPASHIAGVIMSYIILYSNSSTVNISMLGATALSEFFQ